MNYKNLSFTFIISTIFFNQTFCMKQELEKTLETQNPNSDNSVKTEKFGNLGQEHLKSLIAAIIATKEESEKEKLTENALSNSLSFALFKAKYSVKNISDKLGSTTVGKYLPTAEDAVNWLFDLEGALAERELIKEKSKTTLKQNLANKSFLEKLNIDKKNSCEKNSCEKNRPTWFDQKINFDNSKDNTKISFLDKKDLSFDKFQEENREACFEMLCLITSFVKENKEFFCETIEGKLKRLTLIKGWISAGLHSLLATSKDLEKEIRSNIFPEEFTENKPKEDTLKK